MTASMRRQQLRNEDQLVRLSAPKLKDEFKPQYTPLRPPMTATLGEILLFKSINGRSN